MTELIVLTIVILALLYWFLIRKWFGRWGASHDEFTRIMAGDTFIFQPNHSATQAITVNATPAEIWPWLVQIGFQRGGLYSYDWLDRLFGFLDQSSANCILSEFQQLNVGDKISLGPRQELTVSALEPAQALVLQGHWNKIEWVWQFGLYPIGGKSTRLVTRGTEQFPNTLINWLFMRIMEPASFIMTRRMLFGLKERAENLQIA